MTTSNAEQATMVSDHSTTEFRNIVYEVHQVFRLLSWLHIIKVYIFVSPLKVMNDTLVSQLFLNDEYVLKEVYNALLDIEMVEFCYHCLLIFQVFLVFIN